MTTPPLPTQALPPIGESEQAVPSLSGMWRIAVRHGLWGLLVATLIIAGAMHYAGKIVPIYLASASLNMQRHTKPVVFEVEHEGEIDQNFLNGQRDLLLSTPTLERAVGDRVFKEAPAYSGSGDAVAVLRSRLSVTVGKESSAVQVELRDEDPDRAEHGLTAVVNAFLARQEEQRIERTAHSLSFLEKQVKDAQQRVEECRAKEQQFRAHHNIISINPDDNYLAIRLRQLNANRAELEAKLYAGSALASQIDEANKGDQPAARQKSLLRIDAIRQDLAIQTLEKDVALLRDRQVELDQRYLDKHPKVIEVREQLSIKTAQLAEAVASEVATLALKLRELQDQAKALDAQIDSGQIALKEYRENLIALDLLSQATLSENRLYEQLFTRLNEERVTSQLQTNVLTVFDPPHASKIPINIRPTTTMLVAVLLGGIGGLGTVLLIHACDRRVRGHQDLGLITGLPVIARIPFVEKLSAIAPSGKHQQSAALAEAFRSLRTSLKMIFPRHTGCRCLAITSCQPGEGKTTVSVHLALSLASTGARVLLVDADLRNPQVFRLMGDPSAYGLANILAGDKQPGAGPRPSAFANLSLMLVGARPNNPAELLHSRMLPELIMEWRASYDYIIIDTPPLGPVSDALVVGELADGLILLVRDRMTMKSDLRQVLAALAPLGRRVVGSVINGEKGQHARYGYPYLYSTASQGDGSDAVFTRP
jgi:capsular exopolysaccharide synthesis family protein